jgi:OFA family oxalate/formate antiporter-like MFS transporter
MWIMLNPRVVTVLAGMLILMCLGTAYSWGVFLKPVAQDVGWSRAQITFAVSILLLVFSVFMVIGGWCQRKIGAANTATIGGLLVGLGWILASLSRSPVELYLSYGLLAGIGTGLSYMPSLSTGIQCFPEKKGMVAGLITFGFGFGTAVLAPVMTNLIETYTWRTTMLMCGLVFGLLILGASRLLKAPSPSTEVLSGSVPDEDQATTWKGMVRTRAFRIMFSTYFMAMIAGMMMIGHLVAFVQDAGFSPMQGAIALTILSVFNGVGRIFFGYLSDLVGGRKTLVLLFFVMGIAMVSFCSVTQLGLIYFLSALIGFCFGGFLATYPSLTVDYFGRRDFAINYGIIFVGYGSGCFLGPVVGGMVHDVTTSYFFAFFFAGAIAIIAGLLIIFFLRKPQACPEGGGL